MSRLFVTSYVGLLLAFGAVTVDSYPPLQGQLMEHLRVGADAVLLGMTAVILTMGVIQLAVGPLSDRFGRKPLVCCGLAAFLAGTVICALSGTLEHLLVGRTLQGVGVATGMIVGRAILRDLHTGPELAHITSGSTAVMGAMIIATPPLSHLISGAFGWQATFAAAFAYAAAVLVTTIARVDETLAQPDQDALRVDGLLAAVRELFAHPQSRRFIAVVVISNPTLFGYIVGSE